MRSPSVIKKIPPRIDCPTESELRALIGPPSIDLNVAPVFRWKHVPERAFAALLLIPALPVIAVAMLGIVITSPGWPIFCQLRVGRDCRYFRIYKLRTMRPNAEAATGPVFCNKGDARTTWLGKYLRKLHIDELPQLINVVKGEMSMVGPRPERPEFIAVLAKGIPFYANRLTVLPGITGLAAINLPPDTGLESAKRKQILDEEYIESATWWLDIRMIACTALRLVGLSGEKTVAITGVGRTVPGASEQVESPTSVLDVAAQVDETSAVVVAPKETQSQLEHKETRRERKQHARR
ncbi:MAG: sugar transferase [Planctomycetales bacterium]|nr:sugar transferase [Planctomycetales bacterium]